MRGPFTNSIKLAWIATEQLVLGIMGGLEELRLRMILDRHVSIAIHMGVQCRHTEHVIVGWARLPKRFKGSDAQP